MLTKRQYVILNACAEDWEVFYYPFAEVNYGGQVLQIIFFIASFTIMLNVRLAPKNVS